MGAERKASLTLSQFLDSINLDQENMGDLSQLLAGAPYNLTIDDGSLPVPRKESGAYLAAVLGQKLQGQVDKADLEAMIAELPLYSAEEGKALQKGDSPETPATTADGWQPTASDEESEISDQHAGTRKRQRPPEGEADTVSRTVIEPKISKVDVDVIPVKEARRVLNNRKSARKSYIRKKEKMKSMEERVARYEVDFANVNREYLRLWQDYKRLQEENQALRTRLGYNVPACDAAPAVYL